jgi:hypothetical protein
MAARAILAAALMLLPLCAAAQDMKPEWLQDPNTGCKAWTFTSVAGMSIAWAGPCENGLVQGTGMVAFVYKGQTLYNYRGELRAGKFQGKGMMRWDNGVTYSGTWDAGLPNGTGTFVWADGSRYEGGWKDGAASGTGTITDARGNTTTTTWVGGCVYRPNPRSARPNFIVGLGRTTCR